MNELQKRFIESLPDELADHIMVGFAARKMHTKLTQKRKEGRGGWFRSECSKTELIDLLHEHVQKGDMVDVLNLAAMILAKRELEEND